MSRTNTPATQAHPRGRVDFEASAILRSIGGAKALHAALVAVCGIAAPDMQAVWMWRQRNRIAGAWLATVVLLMADRGVPVRDMVAGREPRPRSPGPDSD